MTEIDVGGRNFRFGFMLCICTALFGCGSEEPQDPIGRGRQAVVEQGCETCHTPSHATSETLSGADDPQPNSKAFPSNLTPDPDTGLRGWDDDTILKAILTGIDDEGKQLCPPMPHFADQGMTEDQARDIVRYLRSVEPVHHEVGESSCPPLK